MNLQNWLEEKPFTLALSSGFFGFYAHVGFLKALDERKLNPVNYSGASAGAIVAAAAAAGLSMREIEDLILGVTRKDFWDPAFGLGFVRGEKLERLLENKIGGDFASLKRPLRVSTFNVAKRRTEIFSRGDLAKTIRASCSIPLMFHPVKIGRDLYLDGGIRDQLGVEGLDESANVLSHCLGAEYCARPQRANMQIVKLNKLTRSAPHKLHLGPEIVSQAYRQTLARLDAPLTPLPN